MCTLSLIPRDVCRRRYLQVVYVTAVVPYVVLIILLIWNAQLEDAWLGLKFYLIPDWSKLGTAKVRLHSLLLGL